MLNQKIIDSLLDYYTGKKKLNYTSTVGEKTVEKVFGVDAESQERLLMQLEQFFAKDTQKTEVELLNFVLSKSQSLEELIFGVFCCGKLNTSDIITIKT